MVNSKTKTKMALVIATIDSYYEKHNFQMIRLIHFHRLIWESYVESDYNTLSKYHVFGLGCGAEDNNVLIRSNLFKTVALKRVHIVFMISRFC